MSAKYLPTRLLVTAAMAVLTAFQGGAQAAQLNITDAPLFLNGTVSPLNMLVLGRDHKLYYEAYNDHSDLDGDGTLDVGYNPAKIDYYGYFDSFKCYTYSSNMFTPARITTDKRCGGSGEWSGDWLNYVTTARIDALRKVLYGGKRSTDTSNQTVLERTHIPQDAHTWGKQYTSQAVDGYNIRDYTPYSAPPATCGTPARTCRHLFANTTLMKTTSWTTNGTEPPLLRIAANQPYEIQEWVSIEVVMAGARTVHGTSTTIGVDISASIEDRNVRVEVCKTGLLEGNCKTYSNGTSNKPTGLLQNYGQNDTMLFGLLTGSYEHSKSGGVVRKNVGTISDEINATDGTLTAVNGIIRTMDKFRTVGYTNNVNPPIATGSGLSYTPGLVTTRTFNEGEFGGMWGNPVGEMMYEALRYFAGKSGPTSGFDYSATTFDAALTLPKPAWQDPYGGSRPSCAKPFMTVMSDVNVSYDTDQLPGSYFNSFTGDLGGLNVSAEADSIWAGEFGAGTTSKHFIGESAGNQDGAPTEKTVGSFSNIRGLAPEEPTKEGGYYAASVAHYGIAHDVNTTKTGDQKVQTFSVALASPLPKIEIPVGTGKVTIIPFGKSVGGCCGLSAPYTGPFWPTNQIVDFYVESLTPTTGSFRVNFEDIEAGNDHDMDVILRYEYVVVGNTVTVTLSNVYAAAGIIMHMGYVISGTTADGIYLDVRGVNTAAGNDRDFFLDTPNVPGDLPLTSVRTFVAGGSGATILNDPLWYAAKWGGFKDTNSNDVPDVQTEWDEDGNGSPDNYFLVTNALTLETELSKAFNEIVARVASASSASVNAGSISSETRVYQARFNSGDWSGELLSFPVNTDGSLGNLEWDASEQVPAPGSRAVVAVNANGTAVPFRWASLDATRQGQLDPAFNPMNPLGSRRLDYLRGDGIEERQNGGVFRNRPMTPVRNILGDIVSSAPVFVGKPTFQYSDLMESQPYSTFRNTHANRTKVVYAGANDGMLHAFNAVTGAEMLGFIPTPVFKNLYELTNPTYVHKYFVDGSPTTGDAFYANAWHTVLVAGLNKGGQGIYALDITNPGSFSEANAGSVYRWQFTDADSDGNAANNDLDLGFTYSRPAIVRMQNGRWAAVFGNGYNNTFADGAVSPTGRAFLYIVDIETGNVIRKLRTDVGSVATPNGLATPALVDLNGDSIVDYAFAGDLLGNLWKFNLTNPNPASWDVAYIVGGVRTPLFVATDALGNRQPITSRPEVGRGPKGAGMAVLFGTGKYMELADKDITQLKTQTFYGVIDRNTLVAANDVVSGRALLTQQQILVEDHFNFTDPGSDPSSTADDSTVTVPLRITTANSVGTTRGWYMDLLSGTPGVPPPSGFKGEMQVSDSILRNGRIIFTTLIPNQDPCDFGGTSWLMEMDALSGARLSLTPFDLNNDGQFDANDLITTTLPDGTVVTVPASGLKSEVGITPKPGILAGETAEYKYTPGTTGNIQVTVENPGANALGRQSWRQIR